MKIVATILGIALSGALLMTAGFTLFSIYVPTPRTTDGTVLTIPVGMSTRELAAELKTKKFIASETVFVWYMRLSGRSGEIKAGDFSVPQRANMIDIVSMITNTVGAGLAAGDVSVTIIEGWDMVEVLQALQKKGLPADGEDAWQKAISAQRESGFDQMYEGKPVSADMIGYIYPDTYFFKNDATAETIVKTMVANFERYMTNERRQAVAASSLSFYEVLTLASIVEKEVASDEDRKVVAGIFLNRLHDEYPLQSDATVNYVTRKNTTRPSGADLETESLYNTYKHSGLPPTPICNPSVSAIDAVLHPTPSEYYFFLTTKDGRTIFSVTYQEHLKNTRTYYGN